MNVNRLEKIALYAAGLWVLLAFGFVMFAFGQGKNPYGPISLIVHGSLAFYMILSAMFIRWRFPDLSFSFKEGLKFSVILSVVGNFSLLVIGFIYLKMTWETNFPIYLDSMVKYIEAMQQSGDLEKLGEVSTDGVEQSIESLKKVKAWDIVFKDFGMKMLISLIISFIIAVTMRKNSTNE